MSEQPFRLYRRDSKLSEDVEADGLLVQLFPRL